MSDERRREEKEMLVILAIKQRTKKMQYSGSLHYDYGMASGG